MFVCVIVVATRHSYKDRRYWVCFHLLNCSVWLHAVSIQPEICACKVTLVQRQFGISSKGQSAAGSSCWEHDILKFFLSRVWVEIQRGSLRKREVRRQQPKGWTALAPLSREKQKPRALRIAYLASVRLHRRGMQHWEAPQIRSSGRRELYACSLDGKAGVKVQRPTHRMNSTRPLVGEPCTTTKIKRKGVNVDQFSKISLAWFATCVQTRAISGSDCSLLERV